MKNFDYTYAQNAMGTKLMLVHRKLIIAGRQHHDTERAFVCLSRKFKVSIIFQIYNQSGKAYAQKHRKLVEKCLKT